MTIKEAIKNLHQDNRNLIPSGLDKEYLETYYSNADLLDNYFGMRDSDRILDVDYDDITIMIRGCLLNNDYKYNNLYRTITQDYNPIHNYDGTETVTTTYGKTIVTNENGEVNSSVITGIGKVTDVSSTTNFLSDTENEANKNVTTSDARTDTSKVNAVTNKATSDSHIDTVVTEKGGNLGITTTAQMLEGERQLSYFSFYEILFYDLFDAICRKVYAD